MHKSQNLTSYVILTVYAVKKRNCNCVPPIYLYNDLNVLTCSLIVLNNIDPRFREIISWFDNYCNYENLMKQEFNLE